MPSKRIILFPQDKGGIGKSFVATLLHDYQTDAGVSQCTWPAAPA